MSIVAAVFAAFVLALIKIQIIDAEKYSAYASISSRTAPIKAARGEILDTNGNPLVTNRQGNSIIFESAYFPSAREQEERNKIILSLINLFEARGEEWIDEIPLVIGANGRPAFPPDRERDIAEMKSKDLLNLNTYATAQNCMDALITRYKLENYSLSDARKIASVCYEMKRHSFSISYPYTFAEDVSTTLAAKIKENSNFYRGVSVEIVSYREYADGTLAPHVLGMVGALSAEEYEELKNDGYAMDDTIGKNGLESAMESYLRGTDGTKLVIKNSDGTVTEKTLSRAVQGNTIITTLDANLQKVAQNSLANTLSTMKSSISSPAGCVIAVKVNTGEILASASYPTYDISTYYENYAKLAADKNAPLWNRPLMSTYEPGSTIKLSVALAGLEEGKITEDSVVYCNGTYKYMDQSFKCEQAHTTSSQNVVTALCESCNTFFYECGRRLGYAKMNEYRSLLGLGAKTGVELSEATGVMDSPEYRASIGQKWYPGYNIQTAIGQGNLFTPAQLVNYCATIANGGTRYRLHFVKSIKSYDYQKTYIENDALVLGKTGISQKSIDLVKKGMNRFADEWYGRPYFRDLPYEVAAKTGTSQTSKTINGHSVKINNIFVVSFAPLDDPEIAVCVVGEGGTSSVSLLQTVKDIYECYFSTGTSVSDAQLEDDMIG
ncbi:MAG: hypothetical protein K6F09_01200 [Clostridiales bacterium]|nr:hypothetical protein [Clostridiales bacterium]